MAKAHDIYAIGCTIFEMMYGRQWHLVRPANDTITPLDDNGVTAVTLGGARPDLEVP